jgi:DNA polymerase-3 subunit gamma/tau
MTFQVFFRKWRPQRLAEVVGQKPITDTLLSALQQNRVAQAYLFCGPRGTGKTSTGRILAKAVNCLNNEGSGEPCNECSMCRAITNGSAMDIIEIDAASNNSVDDIRVLNDRVNYSPAEARYKVYIIDEFHMLSTSASNALLKTLEEPPPRVIFILATTELHKILPTIMSRCQRFDFRRLTTDDITDKLAEIATSEGVDIERDGLVLLARAAGGSLRDAENLLQQTATASQGKISLRQVQDSLGLSGDDRAARLVRAVAAADTVEAIRILAGVADDGVNLKQFNREVVEVLRQALLIKTGSTGSLTLSAEELDNARHAAADAGMEYLLRALKAFTALVGNADMHSTLAMEMAIIETTLTARTPPVTGAPDQQKSVTASARTPVRPTPAPATPPPPVKPVPDSKPPETPAPRPVATPVDTPSAAPETSATEVAPVVESASNAPVANLEELKEAWPQILSRVPKDLRRSPALAIMRSAGVEPISFENGKLTLSFKFPIHMNKINEPENKRITVKILSACLGVPCEVECIHAPAANHLVKEAQRRGAEIINVEEEWTSHR